ncbi:AP2/B3-like transcriptional factor family protein, partial [Prunus dulcis]
TAPPRVTVHSGGFWAAAASSGHHSGGTGPQRTVPSSSSHPDWSQPLHRPSSPESGENRSVFTRFSDPPFSFVSRSNRSSKIWLYKSTKESRMSVRSAIRTTLGISPDFGIDYKHHQVKVRSRVA